MKKLPTSINIKEIVDFVNTLGPETKLYIGVDSEKYKKDGKWWADYISVVAVHINGNRGCRLFGAVQSEPSYDRDQRKPSIRLMTEVHKAAELYIEVKKWIPDREIEVHLDLNPDKKHVSNIVVEQAVSYVRAMCGVVPQIKPMAWAGSYCADRFTEIYNARYSHEDFSKIKELGYDPWK